MRGRNNGREGMRGRGLKERVKDEVLGRRGMLGEVKIEGKDKGSKGFQDQNVEPCIKNENPVYKE